MRPAAARRPGPGCERARASEHRGVSRGRGLDAVEHGGTIEERASNSLLSAPRPRLPHAPPRAAAARCPLHPRTSGSECTRSRSHPARSTSRTSVPMIRSNLARISWASGAVYPNASASSKHASISRADPSAT